MTLNISVHIQRSSEAGVWYVKGLLCIPKSLYLLIVFDLVLIASYDQLVL